LQQQPPYFMCPQHWRRNDLALGIDHSPPPLEPGWEELQQQQQQQRQDHVDLMAELQEEFEQAMKGAYLPGRCWNGWHSFYVYVCGPGCIERCVCVCVCVCVGECLHGSGACLLCLCLCVCVCVCMCVYVCVFAFENNAPGLFSSRFGQKFGFASFHACL